MKFPDLPFTGVYVIYDADVVSEHTADITRMAPASHMPAGYRKDSPEHAAMAAAAAKFRQTEGDDQYDLGYLGDERTPHQVKYYPYGTIDAEGTEPDEDYEGETGSGQHRKWVGELSRAEWLLFAYAYSIELDAAGYPVRYSETMGSLTEYGHLEAVCVDNSEGWYDYTSDPVIGSQMYVSFAYAEDPDRAAASLELALAVMDDDGHGCAIGAGR